MQRSRLHKHTILPPASRAVPAPAPPTLNSSTRFTIVKTPPRGVPQQPCLQRSDEDSTNPYGIRLAPPPRQINSSWNSVEDVTSAARADDGRFSSFAIGSLWAFRIRGYASRDGSRFPRACSSSSQRRGRSRFVPSPTTRRRRQPRRRPVLHCLRSSAATLRSLLPRPVATAIKANSNRGIGPSIAR